METKIHFDSNDINGAVDIVKRHYLSADKDTCFGLEMVPPSILHNPDFWVPLLKEDSKLIYKIPNTVFTSDFVAKIDRVKFYEFIPKNLLTAEDFYNSRSAGNGEVMDKIHSDISPIVSKNSNTWILVGTYWCSSTEIAKPYFWLNYIRYYKDKSSYEDLKEYMTKECAEAIWNSPDWYVGYNLIPKHLITDEWEQIKNMYEKRKNICTKSGTCDFETIIRDEALKHDFLEYYRGLKNENELFIAFKVERKIQGNTSKLPGYLYSQKSSKEFFFNLWDAMPVKNQQVADILKDIFHGMVLYIPEEYFRKEDLIPYIQPNLRAYFFFYRKLKKPESCTVEKLEAKEELNYYFTRLKQVILLRYPDMNNEAVENWIIDACNLL